MTTCFNYAPKIRIEFYSFQVITSVVSPESWSRFRCAMRRSRLGNSLLHLSSAQMYMGVSVGFVTRAMPVSSCCGVVVTS